VCPRSFTLIYEIFHICFITLFFRITTSRHRFNIVIKTEEVSLTTDQSLFTERNEMGTLLDSRSRLNTHVNVNVNVNVNLTSNTGRTRAITRARGSGLNCLTSRSDWNLENRSTRRKTSRSRVENQQQTQPGHIGGRRVLSPLRQPCSPWQLFKL